MRDSLCPPHLPADGWSFTPKALKSTLKQGLKEHEQRREGQMKIKGDQSNEDMTK